LTSEGQALSSNNRSGHYAPKIFHQRPKDEREGFTVFDFVLAMQVLLKDGVLIVSPIKRNGHESAMLTKGPKWDQTTESSD
jgi:hypothetical protein